MLNQPKQKKILWVSKEAPPLVMGAHFETSTSGREAVNKWRTQNYVVALIDTGVTSDGLTGFDVVRHIRSLSSRAPVYMMSNNQNGPESILAQRMRVNGFIRRSLNDVQNALRQVNAINWADKAAGTITNGQPATLGKRLMNIFKITTKAQDTTPAPEKLEKEVSEATTNLDDVLSDLSSLDMGAADTPVKMTNDDFIATAGLTNTTKLQSTSNGVRDTIRARSVPMSHQIKNPHDIKLLNFTKLGDDFKELDRQFAWELYTELSTRVPVTGKANDPTCVNTDGELWVESFASLLAFCKELRNLLRTFPAQQSSDFSNLGNLLVEITRVVLNPFLDKWRVDYLHWWDFASDKSKPPLLRQQEYPKSHLMLVEWRELKMTLRAVQDTVLKTYKL